MPSDKFQIRINSILGGQAPSSYFAAEDQFLLSYGINPGLPSTVDGTANLMANTSSGVLMPQGVTDRFTPTSRVYWLESNPKNDNIYMYDAVGSTYAKTGTTTYVALKDLNDTASDEPRGARGNGMAYYDNYIYFARTTTIARYGPLDGSPVWDMDYWGTTLAMTPLTDTTTYPGVAAGFVFPLPNHYLHRHSDGRLYIADVVGNTGTLHYIKTTKTTVEGDTDDGSKYDAVHVGYGLWPTCIESYSSDLAIALYEGTGNNQALGHAKIAFWDTISQDVNQITWDEFPDNTITGLKNLNGVLYVVSGRGNGEQTRISQYIGGYSIKELYLLQAHLPLPGAITGLANRLFFGSSFRYDEPQHIRGGVFSVGLGTTALGGGLFHVMPCSGLDNWNIISAIHLDQNFVNTSSGWSDYAQVMTAWYGTYAGATFGIDTVSNDMSHNYGGPFWISQTYKIGQPFKILEVAFSTNDIVRASTAIVPTIFTDNQKDETTLTTINYDNYPNKTRITIRPNNLTGNNDFNLRFAWSNQKLTGIALPITIEYELLDD